MGLLDKFNPGGLVQGAIASAGNVVGNTQAGQEAKQGLGGLLGKIRETAQDAGQFAGNVAKVTGAKTLLNAQYPETLPLSQSKGMTQFVENGLSALDLFKGKPDGTPGKDTLAGINALREKAGLGPHDDVSKVTRDDVGLMVDQLARKGTPHSQTVLNTAVDTLGGLSRDYPKPAEPTPAPVQRNDQVAP